MEYPKKIALAPLLLTVFCSLVWADEARPLDTDIQIEVITMASVKVNTEQIVVALVPNIKQPGEPVRSEVVQSNAQFRPFISVAQLGSVVAFPNHDAFAHHVYSFSKALSFELPLYAGDQHQELLLEKSGIVPLGCNIHDWMLGYLLVVDTPHFTFLKNNIAEFEQVPVGEYQLTLWHPSMDEFWEKPVSIAATDSRLAITLSVPLSPVNPLPTPNRDNLDEDY